MDKNLARLFELYKIVLLNHISTKASYSQFHEKSASAYEALFDAFHSIAEKRVDCEIDILDDEEGVVQGTYDAIEEAEKIIETMTKQNNSIGMDNLLRGIADRLEGVCGDMRAFVSEEADEDKDKTESKWALLPKK
jgi:hypothetical protein